jgi:hypothetical protein
MATRKGFKFERFREIAGKCQALHAELAQMIAESDAATAAAAQDDGMSRGDPATGRKPSPASDDNDDPAYETQSMDRAFPALKRLRR